MKIIIFLLIIVIVLSGCQKTDLDFNSYSEVCQDNKGIIEIIEDPDGNEIPLCVIKGDKKTSCEV